MLGCLLHTHHRSFIVLAIVDVCVRVQCDRNSINLAVGTRVLITCLLCLCSPASVRAEAAKKSNSNRNYLEEPWQVVDFPPDAIIGGKNNPNFGPTDTPDLATMRVSTSVNSHVDLEDAHAHAEAHALHARSESPEGPWQENGRPTLGSSSSDGMPSIAPPLHDTGTAAVAAGDTSLATDNGKEGEASSTASSAFADGDQDASAAGNGSHQRASMEP